MKPKILLLLLIMQLSKICTAQIKEFYKTTSNAAILLYKKEGDRLIAHGTAFLLCNYDNGSDETILITCEHVTHHDTLIAAIPATDSLRKEFIRQKQTTITFATNNGFQTVGFDGNNLLFSIPVKQGINCYRHSTLDLVAIFCDLPNTLLNTQNNTIPLTNLKTLPKSYISDKNEMYPGQEITFVGFPSGIGTQNGFYGTSLGRDQKTNPLFRKGIISWTSDNADIFLVDGFSYGGNSGSPVFSIPNSESSGKLIGMVFGHLNDEVEVNKIVMDSVDDKIESFTSLHINNGLAKCIPAYLIYDFAMRAVKSRSVLLSQKMKDYNLFVK
ncbi:MAG: serine protease [Ferruginibacter sp.]